MQFKFITVDQVNFNTSLIARHGCNCKKFDFAVRSTAERCKGQGDSSAGSVLYTDLHLSLSLLE